MEKIELVEKKKKKKKKVVGLVCHLFNGNAVEAISPR